MWTPKMSGEILDFSYIFFMGHVKVGFQEVIYFRSRDIWTIFPPSFEYFVGPLYTGLWTWCPQAGSSFSSASCWGWRRVSARPCSSRPHSHSSQSSSPSPWGQSLWVGGRKAPVLQLQLLKGSEEPVEAMTVKLYYNPWTFYIKKKRPEKFALNWSCSETP